MPQQNVELSYRAAEAFNGRDIEGFLELMDADVRGMPLASAAVRMRGHGAGGATPIDETLWRVTQWRDGKCVLVGDVPQRG